MSNLMKIRPIGAEFFYADERMNEHDRAKGRFFAILQKHLNRNLSVMCWNVALLLIFVGFRVLCFSTQQTLYEMCNIHIVLHRI